MLGLPGPRRRQHPCRRGAHDRCQSAR